MRPRLICATMFSGLGGILVVFLCCVICCKLEGKGPLVVPLIFLQLVSHTAGIEREDSEFLIKS